MKNYAQEKEYLLNVELPVLITRIICLSGGNFSNKQILLKSYDEIKIIVDDSAKKAIESQLTLYGSGNKTSNNR